MYIVVQRTPRAEAVRPTRRAISPRFAISTEVIGDACELVVEKGREVWVTRSARATARDLEAEIIGDT